MHQEQPYLTLDNYPGMVPAPLLMERYFVEEQKALRRLEAERDAISRQKEELEEEQGYCHPRQD